MNKHQHRYRPGQLIRGAFEILQEHPDGISVRALLEEMRKRYPPLPGERETINENLSRYEASIHFMSIGAVKAGWLVKQKGKWYITEQGRQAFTKITDPEEFVQQIDKLYRDWYRHARSTQENNTEKVQSHFVLEQAEETAKQDIIAYLTDQLNAYQFQELIAGLLQAIGYHVIWIAPPGPDGGIDIIAYTDPLGLQGPRIKVQVKNRNDKVTAKDIRQFLALLGEGDVGYLLTLEVSRVMLKMKLVVRKSDELRFSMQKNSLIYGLNTIVASQSRHSGSSLSAQCTFDYPQLSNR